MKTLISVLLGGAALLAGPALAHAQGSPQWVAVPPGYTAVLVPDNAAVGFPAGSLPAPPDPQAMIQQINALMAEAEQNADAMQAQLANAMQAQPANLMQAQFAALRNGAAPSAGVVITTISDGVHSCTRRITYPANGGRPDVQLTSTANGCALAGLSQAAAAPALPPATKRIPAAQGLIQAKLPGEMVVADRD